MSENSPKFKVSLKNNQNVLNVKPIAKLIPNDKMNYLNARDSEAKVYFMANCGKSIDLEKQGFVNFISNNDPLVKNCVDKVVGNPQIISKGTSYIRMDYKNTDKLKIILKEYVDEKTFELIKEHIYESPIIPEIIPLSYKGTFRVFTVHDYLSEIGNILYVVFYDPYHLIFPGEPDKKSYLHRKGNLGNNLVSIYDKYHAQIDEKLIRTFDGLINNF